MHPDDAVDDERQPLVLRRQALAAEALLLDRLQRGIGSQLALAGHLPPLVEIQVPSLVTM